MAQLRDEQLHHVFGQPSDSIYQIDARAQLAFGWGKCIVWEGDPSTFQFLYVGNSAELLLGYPSSSWISPNFWAERIVHPDDRRDAIAYCALATGKGRDHDFVYRAVKSDGSTLWLHDVVKVILGYNRVPAKLRGLMFPLADYKAVIPVFDKVNSGTEAVA